jgi:hypothetical protein
MFVKPPGPRHQIVDQRDGIAIIIPARRNIFLFAFLTLWLCGWAVGEIMAPVSFFASAEKDPGAAVFMLVWFCAWTLGGGFAIYVWLWQLRGREIVSVTCTSVSIKRDVFGYDRTKHYDPAEIRALRVSPPTFNPFDFASGMAFWGIGGGAIAFDYGLQTFRFGAGLDEAEAKAVVQQIRDGQPRLALTNVA